MEQAGGGDGVLRLIINGHQVSVTPRAEGGYAWRVEDPVTNDWSRGRAVDALAALQAAGAASARLPDNQRAMRDSDDESETGRS